MSYLIRKTNALFTSGAAVTVANTTTETTLVSTTGLGSTTILNDSVGVGKTFKVKVAGTLSTTGTPTLTFKIKNGSTVLLTSGAVTQATITGESFAVEALVTVYAVGATGSVNGQGTIVVTGSSPVVAKLPMSGGAAVTVDTTANIALDVTAQWSAASTSNTLTVTSLVIEELN